MGLSARPSLSLLSSPAPQHPGAPSPSAGLTASSTPSSSLSCPVLSPGASPLQCYSLPTSRHLPAPSTLTWLHAISHTTYPPRPQSPLCLNQEAHPVLGSARLLGPPPNPQGSVSPRPTAPTQT